MPGASTIRQFITDLHDRKSNIARVFDELFGTNPGRHNNDPDPNVQKVVTWLKTAGPPLPPLSAEARDLLKRRGLKEAELDHIDQWPPGQRDQVRDRLVYAIDNDHPYDFYWELHDVAQADTVLPPLPPPDPRGDIVFRSPRENVSIDSPMTYGDIKVDV